MADRINIGKFSQENYVGGHQLRNFFLEDYEIIKHLDKNTPETSKMLNIMKTIDSEYGEGKIIAELRRIIRKGNSLILKNLMTDDLLKIVFTHVMCSLIIDWTYADDYKKRKNIDPDYQNMHGGECIDRIKNIYYPEYLILIDEVIKREMKPVDFESVYIIEKLICELLDIPLPDRCLNVMVNGGSKLVKKQTPPKQNNQ